MSGIGAHLGRALAAGLIGSVVGTFIAFPWLVPSHLFADERVARVDAASALMMGAIALIFTLPAALLLAAPIIWPFRSWITRHRWLAGLIYAVIGGLAGCAVSLLVDGGTMDPFGRIGAVYGGATGAAFILMIAWTSKPPPEQAPYDAIFE